MARVYGAVAVLATYIIVRRIAGRVAMEYHEMMKSLLALVGAGAAPALRRRPV